MYSFKAGKKVFNSTEEVISMFLGLAIVIVVVSLIFGFFQKRKGSVNIPGISTNIDISKVEEKKESEKLEEKNTYTVVYGDSLWKIAQNKYNDGNKWTELAKINNLKNPRVLTVGQKINLIQAVDEKVATETNKEQTLTSNNVETKDGIYVVTKNDSLWNISVKVYGDGYKWTKIWELNKKAIRNPGVIYVGTKLNLPNLGS